MISVSLWEEFEDLIYALVRCEGVFIHDIYNSAERAAKLNNGEEKLTLSKVFLFH